MIILGSHLRVPVEAFLARDQAINVLVKIRSKKKGTLSNTKSMDQQIYSESVAAILSYELPQIKHFGSEQASGQVQFLPLKITIPLFCKHFNRRCE